MTTTMLYGLLGAGLVGIGLYGVVVQAAPLRRLLGFNLLGCGVFLLFGVIAHRGAAAGMGGDPVPQAIVITGIVVAFAATALALQLMLRIADLREAEERETEGRETEGHETGRADP